MDFNDLLEMLTDVGAVTKGAALRLGIAYRSDLIAASKTSQPDQKMIDTAYLQGARDAILATQNDISDSLGFVEAAIKGDVVKVSVKLGETPVYPVGPA